MTLSTPVVLTIFNRPETTELVFRAIAKAKPAMLLVVADGPRQEICEDAENCRRAREVTEEIDWDCKVLRNYSDQNIGCKRRMASGLDWVFCNVEEAIILEDDCLPSDSFFLYCQELLEYYRYDSRIMQICGSNLLKERKNRGDSYFFSNYGPIWGWASWRRAWSYYDVDMKLWPEIKEKDLLPVICQCMEEVEYRVDIYDKVYNGEIDTWDYQWGFAKIINNGLSIIPEHNLISNIGFNKCATHTSTDKDYPYAFMETKEMEFPIIHPKYIFNDRLADQKYVQEFMLIKPKINSLKDKLLEIINIIKS